jgi:hypothetical protein
MKKLALFILFAFISLRLSASNVADSLQITYANPLDSLKQELRINQYDSLKAGIYAQIAAQYLKYDTIASKRAKAAYQNEAINYTMLALHNYSKYSDTLGMRTCFNYLTKVYRSQKKFSQAKWFVLQSNTISRTLNDKPNIISSLLELAAIKMDIKDYSLAMRDLNEALKISVDNRYSRTEAKVQESFALYYSRTKNYAKEALALKRRDFLNDSITKVEQAILAKTNTQDTVQSKKKLLTARKVTKSVVSSKRMASL